MPREDIRRIPAVVSLDEFAQKLPPELRSELYRTVRDFFCIGSMEGVMSSLADPTSKDGGSNFEAYEAYFSKKEKQNPV